MRTETMADPRKIHLQGEDTPPQPITAIAAAENISISQLIQIAKFGAAQLARATTPGPATIKRAKAGVSIFSPDALEIRDYLNEVIRDQAYEKIVPVDLERAYEALIVTVMAFIKPGPKDFEYIENTLHDRMVDLLLAKGSHHDALGYFQLALGLSTSFAKPELGPSGWRWTGHHAALHYRIGDLLRTQGNLPDALVAYKASLAFSERLSNVAPASVAKRAVFFLQNKITDVLSEQAHLKDLEHAKIDPDYFENNDLHELDKKQLDTGNILQDALQLSDGTERRPLDEVTTSEQLHDLLRVRSAVTGVRLTEDQLKFASETAFNAVIAGVITNPGSFRDPVTGLKLPPEPRKIDFQSRGRNAKGRRMTFDEYLADPIEGWGDYQNFITSSWLNDLDKPLYQALLYQAHKEADERGFIERGAERTAIVDSFCLRHGVLTPGHLIQVPEGLERNVSLLIFITKMQQPLMKGGRPPASSPHTKKELD
jgi:hypothetical protein